MDCPANTVKTRLFHARAKLQKLLPELAGPARPHSPRTPASARHEDSHAGPTRNAGCCCHGSPTGTLDRRAPRREEHLQRCERARANLRARPDCEALTEPERLSYAPGPSFRKLLARIDTTGAAQPRRDGAEGCRAAPSRPRVPAGGRRACLGGDVLLARGLGALAVTPIAGRSRVLDLHQHRARPRTCCTSPSSARCPSGR